MPNNPIFWILVIVAMFIIAATIWWLWRGYRAGGWGLKKVKVKTGIAEAEFEAGVENEKRESEQHPHRSQVMRATGEESRIARSKQRQARAGGHQEMDAKEGGVIEDAQQSISD